MWLFGYGSLIWRPDFPFLQKRACWLHGWERRFWQGSTDHRGTPQAPGRVVTLSPRSGARTLGLAYEVETTVAQEILERLDHREKDGYQRIEITLESRDSQERAFEALSYRAGPDNPSYLGSAPLATLAAEIAAARGPSGSNLAYLLQLAASLRELGSDPQDEPEVFELEAEVHRLLA